MNRPLLTLSVVIHPTQEQAAKLQALLGAVAGIDQAVRHVHRGGEALRLAMQRVAAGEMLALQPVSRLGTSVASMVTAIRDELPTAWQFLPTATLQGLAARYARAPAQPAQPSAPLDAALTVVDAQHIHIEGWPELLIADVLRQPLNVPAALQATGQRRFQELTGTVTAVHAHDQAGDRQALGRLTTLARRFGPLLGREVPSSPLCFSEVDIVHATLRTYTLPDGSQDWAITLALRVSVDWLPRAHRHDTVGVDVGIRRLLTWVSDSGSSAVNAPALPVADWDVSDEAEPFVLAMVRRAQFLRSVDDLNHALLELLTYQTVAIEGTRWSGLAGTPELASMQATGITEVRHWLSELGRVTGTRVIPVSAWQGSHRCGTCGRFGFRDGAQFTCRACGITRDADFNAAMWYRRQGGT